MRIYNKMEKATDLKELRMVCRYYPLNTEDLLKFYVDTTDARGVNMLDRLSLLFEYIPEVYQQILYLGHVASGKSTLLYQLDQKLKGTYNVLRFSIQELVDSDKPVIVDLLFAIYEQILKNYSDKATNNEKLLSNVYKMWFSTIEKKESIINETSAQIEAEAKAGGSIKIVSLFSKLSSRLKASAEERESVYYAINRKLEDYINTLNDLVEEVEKNTEKPLLLMIEDLEKIVSYESAKDLFVKDGRFFQYIKLRLLITAPINLKYSYEFKNTKGTYFTATEMCPMIAVKTPSGEVSEVGLDTMKRILYARISNDLIEDLAAEQLILNSGGVLRDMFTMITEASLLCQIDGRIRINSDDVQAAFIKQSETYQCFLRAENVPLLVDVYNNPTGLMSSNSDFLNLMSSDVIIEYNGIQWRGIHPAIIDYLKKTGAISS